MKIEDMDFVIFDVETTGLEPGSGDRIVEIAALRYSKGKAGDTFSSLINPRREISPGAYKVNKISPQMLKDAPPAVEVMAKFMDFIGRATLAGYNVGFDLGFLENELRLLGGRLWPDTAAVDIIRMARMVFPGLSSYGLGNLSRWLNISQVQEHRALSDALITSEVFTRILRRLKEKGIEDFAQLYHLFGVYTQKEQSRNAEHISAIQRAIDLGVNIKMSYFSGSSAQLSHREVTPKEVRSENGRKYLIGYCRLREEERTFNIKSILDLEII